MYFEFQNCSVENNSNSKNDTIKQRIVFITIFCMSYLNLKNRHLEFFNHIRLLFFWIVMSFDCYILLVVMQPRINQTNPSIMNIHENTLIRQLEQSCL